MRINRYIVLTILISLIFTQLAYAGKKKPDWVKKHPVSQIYYIGIAAVQKTKGDVDYMQKAKDAALTNLASQIQVNIAGDLFTKIVESAQGVEDELIKQIRTTTKAELEGFELVDSWDDDDQYWVYYRLSKTLYEENKQRKLNQAMSLALDLYQDAREYESRGDIEKAIWHCFLAIKPLEPYLNESLQTDFEGRKVYLFNEIYTAIQSILTRTELQPTKQEINGKIGQALKDPLELKVVFISAAGVSMGAANIPIDFSFFRGDGDLVTQARSNNDGIVQSKVSKIKALDKVQMVQAAIDLKTLAAYNEASVIMQSIIRSYTMPEIKFVLNISGLTACIKSEEIHKGGKLKVAAIEPALKEALGRSGFTFTDTRSAADLAIDIKANSRDGSEIMAGMFSSFVDMTVTAVDMSTGAEIFKRTFHKIKGIDLDYNKAGLKAFKNAGDEAASQAVPEILAALQR